MMTPKSCDNNKKNLSKSNLKLIITVDGSSSLLNIKLNDFYHSTKGAIEESLYVYIEQGLDNYKKTLSANRLRFLKSDLEPD